MGKKISGPKSYKLRNNILNKNFVNRSPGSIRHYSTSINTNIIDNDWKSRLAESEEFYSELFERLKINPIYYFDNLDKEEVRQLINRKLKGLGGIYIIINKKNDNIYIGSAITNRFYRRFYKHLISFHGSKPVKTSVKKHGLEHFMFGILEIFPEVITKDNNKELIKLEDKYLKTYLPNYNILLEAGSSFGYKHTEESKLRMRFNYTEERKELIRQLQFSKKGK